MKKVLTILIGILCTLATYAVTYASPYKGQGRGVYTSAGYCRQAYGAQAPTMTMGSTSSYRVMNTTTTSALTVANPMPVRGIQTSASSIQGGVTTYDTEARFSPRRSNTPGHGDPNPDCEHCIDGNDDDICDICGCELLDGCTCGHCTCDVPITDGWQMWLFMTVLTTAYVMYKKRTKTV